MKTHEGLSRLTEREKVCLRLWLEHKTAKEIAVELGITHHAVEKRLKIARLKLGTASSLHAARLLNDAEVACRTAPQAADLGESSSFAQLFLGSKLFMGGFGMTLIGAILATFFMQPADQTTEAYPVIKLTRTDDQLDLALRLLIESSEVGPDGEVFLRYAHPNPQFSVPHSGHYWQVSATGYRDFTSRSLWDRTLKPSEMSTKTIRYYDSKQFENEQLRIVERTVTLSGSNTEWRFVVAMPQSKVE